MKGLTDLPYRVHTNRELGMMMRGKKPLAVFADAYGQFPQVVERYLRLFDRQVHAGALVKREYVVPDKSSPTVQGWHTILYAVPEEEWRIDAMIALRLNGAWTHDKVREEGQLLGYEDWQNEIWLSQFREGQL